MDPAHRDNIYVHAHGDVMICPPDEISTTDENSSENLLRISPARQRIIMNVECKRVSMFPWIRNEQRNLHDCRGCRGRGSQRVPRRLGNIP